ncbi:MAG: type IV secretion system DNA-binding domain-containing protein [Pirellulaceae bacterium]
MSSAAPRKPFCVAHSLSSWSLAIKKLPEEERQHHLHEVSVGFPGGSLQLCDMAPHFAIVGSSGAGKTILQKGLIQALLPMSEQYGGLRYRAVVYDPKRELFPYLVACGIPRSQIIVTHPFDDRAAAWDLAADFREPAQIEELAEMIVPRSDHHTQQQGNNAFFENTARIILQDLIEGLRATTEDDWELRDVLGCFYIKVRKVPLA